MRPDTHECTWTGIACIPQADDVEQILRTYHPLTGTARRVPSRPTWEFFFNGPAITRFVRQCSDRIHSHPAESTFFQRRRQPTGQLGTDRTLGVDWPRTEFIQHRLDWNT